MPQQYILNFTPTGMVPTRKMTPHVPLLPREIIAQVCEAAALGANMIHLHVRDPHTEKPTWKKELYAECIGGIREKYPDLLLGVSTSGRDFPEFERRSECLDLTGDLKPDFASLTLSSLNFNKQASLNSPDMIQNLAKKMLDNGIKPELEAFDLGMINYAKYLMKKDLIKPPYYINLILGNIACAQADLMSLGLMINQLPEGYYWSVGGIGDSQLPMNTAALATGGGIRIGLEDNIYFDAERTKLATNLELIQRIMVVADSLGLKPYSRAEARQLLIHGAALSD